MTGSSRIPLTKPQAEVLKEFYSCPETKVIFVKSERKQIWDDFKATRTIPNLDLERKCPALLAELGKALSNGNLVQSAVFSECVYAQTLANMLQLDNFFNFAVSPESVPPSIANLIASYHLTPRYVYKSADGSRMLVQAGGNAGVDSALISVHDNNVFTIEFKEPGAKTSEPDLPAYGEDGNLVVTTEFLGRNSQFEAMLKEQVEKNLNFWNVMGSNVNSFSLEAIQIAVSENYAAKKYADVICVEDRDGYLAMMPANQVGLWSITQGEIRPAGRNSYAVWTPMALAKYVSDLGGTIDNGNVSVPLRSVATASQRGGDDEISRYKLNSLFFVRVENAKNVDGTLYFKLEDVKQLKPTIAAKMFFTNLEVAKVHAHYSSEF
jgi:hypothetical protein